SKYQFRFDRKKSAYFYADILKAGDFHTFDFDRHTDSGRLKIWLGNKAHAYVDFNRYSKKGESTTTYNINRVEFEFVKPVDEKSADFTLGVDYSNRFFSIAVEDRIQDYKNANNLFLPGYADGGQFAGYPSALYYLTLSQPYDMKGNIFCTRISAAPLENLQIRGSFQFTNQDTDITYSEEAKGIDYLDDLFMYAHTGQGQFSRDIYLYDLDFSYIITKRFGLIGAARYNDFKQKGSLTGDNGTTAMDLQYEIGGLEGGFQWQPNSAFDLTFGVRFEQRNIDGRTDIEEENGSTKRDGFFGNVKWHFFKSFGFTADYQLGTYQNPFTLVSPSDFQRSRVIFRYQVKGFYALGSVLHSIVKNENDETKVTLFKSSSSQINLGVGIDRKKIKGSLGFALINVKREADRTIFYPPSWSGAGGSFLWEIFYEGKANLFDASIYIEPNNTWGLGGYFNYYRNKGSWALSRTSLKILLRYTYNGGLTGELAYRLVDFKEKRYGYNNYKATIFEISLGYKW
ncbi:MAG TPA: hypothetical protein VK186_23960, partial [Candidatus Deferrimicrobium sp.]|nr:hypothetical protein [Candidatus Deferrimicrobium sp.]